MYIFRWRRGPRFDEILILIFVCHFFRYTFCCNTKQPQWNLKKWYTNVKIGHLDLIEHIDVTRERTILWHWPFSHQATVTRVYYKSTKRPAPLTAASILRTIPKHDLWFHSRRLRVPVRNVKTCAKLSWKTI